MINYSQTEIDKDIINLDTVQSIYSSSWIAYSDALILMGIIMDKFRFGYGGYNGYFQDREELVEEITKFIDGLKKHYNTSEVKNE